MSNVVSRWIDKHITHDTEIREAKERSDKQIREFEEQKNKLKAEHDSIDASKKIEKERREQKTIKRLKGGMRKAGFLTDSDSTLRDQLG